MGKKKGNQTARVEFGNEFLDMNASKVYEVTNSAKKKDEDDHKKG